MNNRLLELATEADLIRYPSDSINIKIEKFAALIVEECANVADENYIHRGSRTCGLAIRLHFGVEE